MASVKKPTCMSGLTENPTIDLTHLKEQLNQGPLKTQFEIIESLTLAETPGLKILMEFLRHPPETAPITVLGLTYQVLYDAGVAEVTDFLKTYFPDGVVPLKSGADIDYRPLQQKLLQQDFQAGDRLTLQKLCELAGPAAQGREWLYFTEVKGFPDQDLQTIDALWLAHSRGQFGFSVQRRLWLGVNRNWDRLWPKIGWRNGNNWTRYPQGFTWELSAPQGHLPLSNQLRGVRVMEALLSHPAWSQASIN